MADDPLYQPLRLPAAAGPSPRRQRLVWGGLIVLAAVLAGGAGLLVRHQHRARPSEVAVAAIETSPRPPAPAAPAPPPAPAETTGSLASNTPTAASDGGSVEIQHGVKIIRLGAAASSASVAIPVMDQAPVALKPAPDPALIENTRWGALPRIGANGARPADVYAGRAGPGRAGGPRIALVASGMGMNQLDTAELSRRVPPAVTFAFPPAGPDLPTQVAETRAAGHEVVLQLPEEDASAPAMPPAGVASIDRVRSMMSRFSGYAGVSLPRGGDPETRQAVLRELERRGLYPVDTAASVAATVPTPQSSLRSVDMVLPANAEQAALDRLVDRARTKGSAVGWIAGASPDVIAGFARGLARQNIALVPLSALADARGTPQAAQ